MHVRPGFLLVPEAQQDRIWVHLCASMSCWVILHVIGCLNKH
jgi:hypothetical protein